MLTIFRCATALLASILLSFSLSSQAENIFSPQECRAHIPESTEAQEHDPNAPFVVKADELHATQDQQTTFNGNVEFSQGSRSLSADQTLFDQQQETLTAEGNIHYTDHQVTVNSERFHASTGDDQASLDAAQYQLHGSQGRGEAHNLTIKDQQNLRLENASYTACPPDDISWEIRAAEINIDNEEQWATTRNATVRLYDVPVMYLPYFSYPIGDQRHSGFLFPSISTSTTNGIDIAVPYYWNIAPNFDATITPRYMSRRGLQLQNEFRYLVDEQQGMLNLDYLHHDDEIGENRYLINWEHSGQWKRHWRIETEYTKISDDNYFNDLGDKLGKESDNQLLQNATLSYHNQHWYSSLIVQDFQMLGNFEPDERPHTLLPQMTFSGDWNLGWHNFTGGVDAELSHFSHDDNRMYTAKRIHIEPNISFPYSVPAGFFNADFALMHTYYQQDRGNTTDYVNLADSVNRTLPKVSLHGGLNFDRETHYFGQNYTQTLEPEIKYLYIPYTDQSDIGLYDTDNLQQDYYGLFRDQRFSGRDRIADANQITLGLRSRFLDENNQENLRLSLGQIFYLESSRVTLNPDSTNTKNSNSALAFEFDSKLSDDWFSHAGVQYDNNQSQINNANAAIEWRPHTEKLVQLNYRYSLPDETMVSEINQLGSQAAWPINGNISAVGRYYRDINLNRSVESYLGLQYNSCCWGIRLAYQRKLQSNYSNDDVSSLDNMGTFDTSLRLDFELIGLGGSQNTGQEKMLDSGSLNYGRPFYLND